MANAGCAGPPEGEASPTVQALQAPDAEFDESTGALSGVVFDEELKPLEAVDLGLEATEFRTRSAQDGSFTFSRVPPGDYVVLAARLGYQPWSGRVAVEAGRETSGLNVDLARIPVVDPYYAVETFDGLIECAWGAPGISANCLPLQFLFQQLGINPTSTRIIGLYNVTDPDLVAEGVFELSWRPSAALSSGQLLLAVEQEGTGVIEGRTYASEQGSSPVRVRTGTAPFEDLEPNNRPIVQTRVFPAQTSPPTVVVQQRFGIFATFCYHAACPPEYTALADS